MSTSSVSAGGHAEARRLPTLDGWPTAAIAIVVAVALIVIGDRSLALFAAAYAAGLLVAAYAAHRWPMATLVASTLVILADLVITGRIAPDGLDLGVIGLSEPLLAVVGVVIAIGAIRRGTFLEAMRDPVLALSALFVVMSVISAVANQVPPQVAALGIVMTVDAIAIYFVARMAPADETGRAIAIGAIVGTVVVVCLFGIGQVIVAPSLLGFSAMQGQFGEGVRITSIIGHPNMVATLVGIGVPFTAFAARHLASTRGRWIARAALLVLLVALIWTFSRGGWLAVGVGTTVGLLLVDWRAIPIFFVALALAWGAATIAPRAVAVPDDPSGPTTSGSGGPSIVDSTVDRIGSLSDRNDTRGRYLRDGLRIVAANPLLGVGPGRYGGAAATITESPVYEQYDATLFGYRTVHNFWLHLGGEGGLLGAAVFVTMILGVLVRFLRVARESVGLRRIIVGGAATMLIVSSLHGVTEMTFEGNMPALLIWLLLGIAAPLAPSRPLFARAGVRSAPASA